MSAITVPLLTVGLRQPRLYFPLPVNRHCPFPGSLRRRLSCSVLHNGSHGVEPLRASRSESISEATSTVSVENDDASDSTTFVIRARNRIGLLQVITRVFSVLGLRIERAIVELEGEFLVKKFYVTDSHGKKIEHRENLERIEEALLEAIDGGDGAALNRTAASPRGIVVRRAGLLAEASGDRRAKAEKMFGLMDGFLKNDPISLQKDILDHVEYTVARSRFNFDDFEAYQARVFSMLQH